MPHPKLRSPTQAKHWHIKCSKQSSIHLYDFISVLHCIHALLKVAKTTNATQSAVHHRYIVSYYVTHVWKFFILVGFTKNFFCMHRILWLFIHFNFMWYSLYKNKVSAKISQNTIHFTHNVHVLVFHPFLNKLVNTYIHTYMYINKYGGSY